MRVVIDTNVLVSAALHDKDPEAVITWVVVHPDWLWLVTPDILAEYKAVLSRSKFEGIIGTDLIYSGRRLPVGWVGCDRGGGGAGQFHRPRWGHGRL